MSILLSILDVTFSFGGVVKKRREGSARLLGVLFVDQSELGRLGILILKELSWVLRIRWLWL
jgi:hypothetical protein